MLELELADHIRSFHKERDLTQEQLAEVLGVTTGAVYQWESRLSPPEVTLYVFNYEVQIKNGDENTARRSFVLARKLADHFDADPNDCAEVLRFISDGMQVGIYDDLGMTASESVQKTVESLEDSDISLIWEEVNDHA